MDYVILPPYHYLIQFIPVSDDCIPKVGKTPRVSFLKRHMCIIVDALVLLGFSTALGYYVVRKIAPDDADVWACYAAWSLFTILFFAVLVGIRVIIDDFLCYKRKNPKPFELWRIFYFVFIDDTVYDGL